MDKHGGNAKKTILGGATQMRKLYLSMALALTGALAMASAAFAAGTLPGSEGPYDTKALVSQPAGSSVVTVMWSTTAGNGGTIADGPDVNTTITFTVYKHSKGDGRSFNALGSCEFNPTTGAVTGTNCGTDSNYGYVTFTDSAVTNYEEYSYYVSDEDDADPTELVSKVVVRAFPPVQTRHGNYTEYTNACTACHGLHSSKFKKLLKGPTVTDLCGTCHDGTGSKYDEVRGRVRTSSSWASAPFAAAGPFGDRLKANSGVTTTSAHNITRANDPSLSVDGPSNIAADSAQIWQAPGSTFLTEGTLNPANNNSGFREYAYISNNWGSQLACSSCHEPHDRGKNYRILRPVINDRTNIALRGVVDVDLTRGDASATDRGNWQSRTMYTQFLAGGNSTMIFYENKAEDPAKWAGADGIMSATEKQAVKDWCVIENDPSNPQAADGTYLNTITYDDATSPTGVRCLFTRELGGVTTFCTACHRTFMWSEARISKTSYAYAGESASTSPGTMSGGDKNIMTNGNFVPSGGNLNNSIGQHKHPISLPPLHAFEEGRIVEGVLANNGEVCRGEEMMGFEALTPECQGVGQGRVIDPILPLEGTMESVNDPLQNNTPVAGVNEGRGMYLENILMCMTCHVPHGSGSERVEVAYKNDGLNDTIGAVRDPITGYLWNRATNANTPAFGGSEIAHSNGAATITDSGATSAYVPNNTDFYTQYGFSSVLARFNPFASVCFRCHSTTPDAWTNLP